MPMSSGKSRITSSQQGTTADDDLYYIRLTRSSHRLHLQHWVWKYQLGYDLHPQIDVSKKTALKIADVAAGNGQVCATICDL